MFKKTIALAGTAALMALGLTGCGATLGGGAQPDEAAASAEAASAAQQICLIQNPHIKVAQMPEAVTEGLKYAGYEVKLMPGDSMADVCEHCVAYGLKLNEKGDALEAILFQSFRNGQPEFNANGPAEKGQLTLQQVAQYAAMFAVELKKRTEAGGAPTAQEPAAK